MTMFFTFIFLSLGQMILATLGYDYDLPETFATQRKENQHLGFNSEVN